MTTLQGVDVDDHISSIEAEVQRERSHRKVHVGAYLSTVLILLALVVSAVVTGAPSLVPLSTYGSCVLVAAVIAHTGYLLAQRDKLVVLRSKLSRLRDKRRDLLNGEVRLRTAAYTRYRDGIPDMVEAYRLRAGVLRRLHNTLQAVVIAGSVAAATLTAAMIAADWARWVAVVLMAAVAVCAGLSGSFRFRERGLHLQHTANQIERELRAAELRICDYQAKTDEAVLLALAVNVEHIRDEHRQREQQLDQPAELRYLPLDDRG
ncbi:MAG TPA: DUF4231 domain-containing protein [Mycobacteriales bacterium]|nr:DUF4231 domain-containing protein [Mycobacteriales bacterium]